MASLPERILEFIADSPGHTDREITNHLVGRSDPQQPINQACHRLKGQGLLERKTRDDGLIGNYPSNKKRTNSGIPSTVLERNKHGIEQNVDPSLKHFEPLSEDFVKAAMRTWLEEKGWSTQIAWGKERGIDILAQKEGQRWVIEAKGKGAYQQMSNNYFLGVIGTLMQKMDDPKARYSLAFPRIGVFTRLWDRLPDVPKLRLSLSVFFVDEHGSVEWIKE